MAGHSVTSSDSSLVGSSVISAANALGLSHSQLGNAIGVSVSTISQLKNGAPIPGSKPMEMALLVIRIYRALYAIVGGNATAISHWMSTPNKHFSQQSGQPQIPAEMIQSAEGLARLISYLDLMRGRV